MMFIIHVKNERFKKISNLNVNNFSMYNELCLMKVNICEEVSRFVFNVIFGRNVFMLKLFQKIIMSIFPY